MKSAGAPRQTFLLLFTLARGACLSICFWLMLLAPEIAVAQVLDAGRGHEDGCNRPGPPPHGETARSQQGPVVAARYFGSTNDYPHGVLGDEIEAEGVLVRYDNGERVICDTVLAGTDRVFEDITPRLADLDGDGVNEVITVASHAQQGARLEVYGYPKLGQDFQLLAATPYIGTRFRWLAPVAVADLDGDGFVEIAYVDRPHLAKTLRIWRYRDAALEAVGAMPGVSNHKIGWPFIVGGLRDCGAGPEMILGSANWRDVVSVRFADGEFATGRLARFSSPEQLNGFLDCD
ncbi:MAG: VCBS repeat-containing protein [Pseudomonadota bacterium]